MKKISITILLVLLILLPLAGARISNNTLIPSTSTPLTNATMFNTSWLYEGPIYETHPYYYPGHSFKEITEQVPSLADLGIKTIYLMPIWVHTDKEPATNYIYLIDDYYKIDPVYGTEEELKELVDTVHNHNMKIIFDLVTCCTSSGVAWDNNWTLKLPLSKLEEKATELGWNLEYTTYNGTKLVYYGNKTEAETGTYEFVGQIIGDEVVAYYYPIATFGPAIDRSNLGVINYFTNVAEYYVAKYNIDGGRLDAPNNDWNPKIFPEDHSSLALLRDAKKAVTNAKSDGIFLAEVPYLNPSDSALDEISEASYSHGFGKYVYSRILKSQINSTEFIKLLAVEKRNIKYNRTRVRYVEDHGSQRINKVAPQLNKPLIVLTSTIPGIPMIQAGQEIGAINEWFYQGNANPQVNWTNGDVELRNFYKKVFGIRNNNNPLKYGTIKNVWKSGDNIFAYLRSYENEHVIVALNFLNIEAVSSLNLSFLSKGAVLHDELNNEDFVVNDPNNFELKLQPYASRILILKP